MKIKKLNVFFLVAICFITFGVTSGVAQETMKLGNAQSLTGPVNIYGITINQGIAMCIEDLNAGGGINGKKIELIIYDTTSKPPVATTLAQRLIFEDKVLLVIGSGSSLDNLAMMEVTEKENVPLIVANAASPQITGKGYKWVWRASLNDKTSAISLGKYISQKPQWKRIALLHENSEWGNPPTDILAEIIKASKGKELVARETFSRADTSVTGQLMKIKGTKPDLMVAWGTYGDSALIARQYRQVGLEAQLMGTQAIQLPEYLQLAGEAAEGVLCYTSTSSQVNPDPKIQAFVKRYEAKFHREMYGASVDGYDAMMVIAETLKKVGTDRKKIQNALNTMTFQGIAEPIKFDSTGQAIRQVVIAKVEGGKFKFVEYIKP